MADILKNSYLQSNLFTKILFQRGKDVLDFELNELQDILFVFLTQAMFNGLQNSPGQPLNPGSNDNGYKCVGNGSPNEVIVDAGTLFCDGIPIELFAPFTSPAGLFSTAGSNRTDCVYLGVTVTEITDPAQVPQLGETTRRDQLTVTMYVSTTGIAGVPPNVVTTPATGIWGGEIHYFPIALVTRRAGDPTINVADVQDIRWPLLPSLLPRSQWTVTCGDGILSFGNFNGPNAIQQAAAALQTLGFTSYRIFVKQGNFSFTDTTTMPLNITNEVFIQGSGQQTILNFNTSAGAPITANCHIHFEDLVMQYASGTNHVAVDYSFGRMSMLNVHMFALGVIATSPAVLTASPPFAEGFSFHAKKCNLDMSAQGVTTTAGPPLPIVSQTVPASAPLGGVPSPTMPIIFEDCLIIGSDSNPVVMLKAAATLGANAYHSGVKYNRCKLWLGKTTTGTNGTQVWLNGNPGPLDVNPNGNVSGATIVVESLSFYECDVVGGRNNPGTAYTYSSIMLHTQITQNSDYAGANGVYYLNHVLIKGGVWKVTNVSSFFNPFLLVAINPVIEDVTFVLNGLQNGSPNSEFAAVYTNVPVSTSWAAIVVCNKFVPTVTYAPATASMSIKNVTVLNAGRASLSGDVWIAMGTPGINKIDGLNVTSHTTSGPLGLPDFRVKVTGGGGGCIAQGIGLSMNYAAGNNYLGQTNFPQQGYLVLQTILPSGDSGDTEVMLVARDCTVLAPTITGGATNACICVMPDISSNPVQGIVLENCKANNGQYGLRLDGGSSGGLIDVEVLGGMYSGNGGGGVGSGIYVNANAGVLIRVKIDRVRACTNTQWGLEMLSNFTTTANQIDIVNSTFLGNGAADEVALEATTILSGQFRGNELGTGSVIVRENGATYTSGNMTGLETGYGALPTYTPSYVNGHALINNRGILDNP